MNQKPMFPYHWNAADLYELTPEDQAEVAKRKKRCAICGKEESLTHQKYSGGCLSYLSEGCAVDYVLKAESVKDRYEKPVPVTPEPEMMKTFRVTAPAVVADSIRKGIKSLWKGVVILEEAP